jgi:hypothetical protein
MATGSIPAPTPKPGSSTEAIDRLAAALAVASSRFNALTTPALAREGSYVTLAARCIEALETLKKKLAVLEGNPIGWSELSPTPQDFKLFSELPAEIKLKIWKEAMPKSRIIEVRWSEKRSCFVTACPVPTLFHVCFDCRKYTLERYNKIEMRSDHKALDEDDDQFTFRTYVDWSRDIIFPSEFRVDKRWSGTLFRNFIKRLVPSTGDAELQHIALDIRKSSRKTLAILANFPKLQTITLVSDDSWRHLQYKNEFNDKWDWRHEQPLKFALIQDRIMTEDQLKLTKKIEKGYNANFRIKLLHQGVRPSIAYGIKIKSVDVERPGSKVSHK